MPCGVSSQPLRPAGTPSLDSTVASQTAEFRAELAAAVEKSGAPVRQLESITGKLADAYNPVQAKYLALRLTKAAAADKNVADLLETLDVDVDVLKELGSPDVQKEFVSAVEDAQKELHEAAASINDPEAIQEVTKNVEAAMAEIPNADKLFGKGDAEVIAMGVVAFAKAVVEVMDAKLTGILEAKSSVRGMLYAGEELKAIKATFERFNELGGPEQLVLAYLAQF